MNRETIPSGTDEQALSLASYLTEQLPHAGDVSVLVIAGSGLGGFARSVRASVTLSYSDLPHVGASTVAGHAGALVLGTVGEQESPILLMNGRRHVYEGISLRQTPLLLRAVLVGYPGVRSVIISNAAGGLNRSFEVADLMLISDHINWMFKNPLIGHNKDEWGQRFPDLSDVYSKRLRGVARDAALEAGIVLREGVYIGGHGPSYETRAEVNFFRNILGGDAVGMSTVPEALICAHMGREALGISFISNLLTEPAVTSHEEVMDNSRKVEDKFRVLLTTLLGRLDTDNRKSS